MVQMLLVVRSAMVAGKLKFLQMWSSKISKSKAL